MLSCWSAGESVVVEGPERFDAQTAMRVRQRQALLFNICVGMKGSQCNLRPCTLDVCTTRLLHAYSQLKAMHSSSPVVERLHAYADQVGLAREELLCWPGTLEKPCTTEQNKSKEAKEGASESNHQAAVIHELTEANALLNHRLDAIERKQDAMKTLTEEFTQEPSQDAPQVLVAVNNKPCKNSQATHPFSVMFGWYAGVPSGWQARDHKKKSESKFVVAYMKLFLRQEFQLVEDAFSYRNKILALGQEVKREMLIFLQSNGVQAKGSSSVLKRMYELQRQGLLNKRIRDHRALAAAGLVSDSAPRDTQEVFHIVE